MGNKMHKSGYLFVSVDYKNRLVKISAVTNIVAFLRMMRQRYPEYRVYDAPFSTKWNTGLHHKIMKILNDCRSGTQGEFRTYNLDNYRVQTVIRLLTRSNQPVIGHDLIKCQSCNELYEADYSEVKDIYKFVSLDLRYCSDDCIPKVTREWSTGQRYCRCGQIYYPKHNLDFYCSDCLNSVSK